MPEIPLTYQIPRYFSATIAGKTIRYASKPGLPDWARITPAQHLLAEGISLSAGETLLFLGCRTGAAGCALASTSPGSNLVLADENYVALQMAKLTIEENQASNIRILSTFEALAFRDRPYDIVAIDLPKGRRLAQRWLALAFQALKPGGRLYLAGQNDHGIQAVIRDAGQLFQNGAILNYRKGNRLATFIRPEQMSDIPGWWHTPGIAPDTWHEMNLKAPGDLDLQLASLPGIFSYDRLDPGTKMLLDCVTIRLEDQVLDLGCGYGIIGLWVARQTARQVDLVDSNLAAVKAAQENLRRSQVSNAFVYPSDVLSAVRNQRYNLILANPPFHAGKEVDQEISQAFIQESWQALQPGGRLVLVANRFLRYDKIAAGIFQKLELLEQTGQYYVLQASRG